MNNPFCILFLSTTLCFQKPHWCSTL